MCACLCTGIPVTLWKREQGKAEEVKIVTQQQPGFFAGDATRPNGAHSLGRRWTGSLLYFPELPEPAYS